MIRLGLNTLIWSGRFGEQEFPLLDKIRAWGADVVEIPIFDPGAVDAAPIRRAVADSGLALTACTALPRGLGLVSADAAVRQKTRDWLRLVVDRVAAVGGTLLVGPVYAPVGELPGRRTDAQWRLAVDEFRLLDDAISGSGVQIAIEPVNRFETCFFNTAADTGRVVEEAGGESLGVLFDTFHANIEEGDLLAALASLGERLIHVHLCENNRGVPGSGHIPFPAVAETLRAMSYSGYAVVESFASMIPEIAAATAMWRDYAASPDEFAAQSILNMRRLFPASSEKHATQ